MVSGINYANVIAKKCLLFVDWFYSLTLKIARDNFVEYNQL